MLTPSCRPGACSCFRQHLATASHGRGWRPFKALCFNQALKLAGIGYGGAASTNGPVNRALYPCSFFQAKDIVLHQSSPLPCHVVVHRRQPGGDRRPVPQDDKIHSPWHLPWAVPGFVHVCAAVLGTALGTDGLQFAHYGCYFRRELQWAILKIRAQVGQPPIHIACPQMDKLLCYGILGPPLERSGKPRKPQRMARGLMHLTTAVGNSRPTLV